MPGNTGRHRISRRTKIATGALALAIAAGGIVVATTFGEPGKAGADEADPALYIDILKVAPNNSEPANSRGASTGTFTVDCGRNENGHFNPDNFVAQPGIRNGAQHLHDYVGNLSSNADSNNKSLDAAGTTCKNGDKSAYFWPVVRIDTADEEKNPPAQSPDGDRDQASQAATTPVITCPDVASKLPDVPDSAMAEINRNLDLLDTQVDEANQRLASTQGQGGPNFVQNAILGPLKDKRAATIDRMAIAIGRTAAKPQGLDALAPCTLKEQAGTGGNSASNGGGAPGGAVAQQITCPDVASKLPAVPASAKAEVDRNLKLLNSQLQEANNRLATSQGQGGPNFVQNAILGPLKDKRAATIDRMAIAIGRTAAKPQGLDALAPCTLGQQTGTGGDAKPLPGADENNELPDNDGEIQRPAKVGITFRGSPAGQVTAMPKFLRALTGDAKPSVNGTKNTRAAWTCTGFENRLTDKYPICPDGSKVERIHTFPSCWDGKNTDSANHRTHIVFPDKGGRCAQGFTAVPQLRITLVYDIPHDIQVKKQYKVDSFPQEDHNPLSDHDDFANVMSQRLMNQVVNCINRNKTCNA
ncbi:MULTISPECIES: DUF1996 domain-containing protein [unclassified Amycolatopsis]|uniref:DUF1996 domain-containing protein n=1 Tax=unclassified Amycolatopsis TaxID=2618356 RepID=UPI002E244756|nr:MULTISPECIES: DUF1996 domain-containing protein [unclassified Amycolatopsis]